MIILKIILIIILLIEIAALILFQINYEIQFSFSGFMSNLDEELFLKFGDSQKYDHIFIEFEKVFGHYYDNAALGHGFSILFSLITILFTLVSLTILIIWQFCNKCKKCKKCFNIYFPIYSLINMALIIIAFSGDNNKINLPDDEIYIFGDTFNKEIKKNLDIIYKRKIYLIVCVSVTVAGIISQFIIILIVNIYENKNDNNIPIQPQILEQQPYIYQYNLNSNINVNINNENPDVKETEKV